MKILLASMSIEERYRFEEHINGPYSLGLAYISSYLKLNGHEVKILFLNNKKQEQAESIFMNEVDNFKPEVIGFQVFSMVRTSTFSVIELLKDRDVKIVLGGIHATIMYEQILERFPESIVVLGEGEITLTELVDRFQNNKDISDVAGIAYMSNGDSLVKTPTRVLLKDIDSLPYPDHEFYFNLSPHRTVAHMISSRGCPFHCTFCALKVISQGKVRKRSVDSVIDEIVTLKKNHPHLQHIQFHDDTMLLDNPRMIEFCKKIVELNLDLTFECSARVKPVSEELFSWMEKAGFTKIMFGLETGSQAILKSIKKKISREDVLNLFELLRKFDFDVTTFLIIGFPGENMETVQETIDLVNETQRIKYNLITGVGILWVYPGTEVYELAKRNLMMTDDFWMTDKSVPYYTVDYSLDELRKMQDKVLDAVSISRICTVKGFKSHFLKMPLTIIRYGLKRPRIVLSILKRELLGKNK